MFRQIQEGSPGSNAIPLFLFHDASGTISSYYKLGPMGRDIYAVADSPVESETPESFSQMCRRYYAAIKKLSPEGRILLGGWSLGGMIALQVAWNFARDPAVKVDGVIMMDSPFPAYDNLVKTDAGSSVTDEFGQERYRPQNRLEKSMLKSINLLHSWRVPVWRREQQPPTVMLCANEHVDCDDQPAFGFVDQFRESPTLGWNERAGNVVDRTYTIPGHHFGLFEPRNVVSTTETIAAVAIDMELSANADDSD